MQNASGLYSPSNYARLLSLLQQNMLVMFIWRHQGVFDIGLWQFDEICISSHGAKKVHENTINNTCTIKMTDDGHYSVITWVLRRLK